MPTDAELKAFLEKDGGFKCPPITEGTRARLVKRYFDQKARDIKGSVLRGDMEALAARPAVGGKKKASAAPATASKTSSTTSARAPKASTSVAASPAALSSDAILNLLEKG